jgi:hypothetical protein
VSRVEGTSAFLLTSQPLQGNLKERLSDQKRCGPGSATCPNVVAPWLPDMSTDSSKCFGFSKESTVLAPLSFIQTCPQTTLDVFTNSSSPVAGAITRLRGERDSEGRATLCPSILDWLPAIAGAAVGALVVCISVTAWFYLTAKHKARVMREAVSYR